MTQEFSLDLRAARRNSGLKQVDCAHLMGVHESKISQFETGKKKPSVKEICQLSMIFGRSFESLFAGIFEEVRQEIGARMMTLSEPGPKYLRKMNRNATLQSLEIRLRDNPYDHYGCGS